MELFHTKFSVSRLQPKYQELRKKRPQSLKLRISQSDNDRPRNNSGKGCHQTDTLLGKMKILLKKGAELFHPQFSILRLQYIFHGLRKKRPQPMKL